MLFITYLFQFITAHAVADFVLQHEAMGRGKNRHDAIHQDKPPHFPAWYYWLTSHALIHGGAVYIITGSVVLGMIETLLHWLIDYAKCEGYISFHQDQTLHFFCKIAYCVYLAS